jgi:hypothetical protein
MAYLLFHNFHVGQCHLVAQVDIQVEAALQVEVLLVLVVVYQFLCTSSVSVDSLLCHCAMEGSHPYDF